MRRLSTGMWFQVFVVSAIVAAAVTVYNELALSSYSQVLEPGKSRDSRNDTPPAEAEDPPSSRGETPAGDRGDPVAPQVIDSEADFTPRPSTSTQRHEPVTSKFGYPT